MFKETPANIRSMSVRRLIYGVATNDSDYKTELLIDGKRFVCPFYMKWTRMLQRCYSEKYTTKNPSYKDVKACYEWLVFSNFKAWMIGQDWNGNELDKDILIQGNKVYSPETCLFVSHEINSLFNNCNNGGKTTKTGVTKRKGLNRFRARHNSKGGGAISIGEFDTEKEAFEAYCKYKYSLIKSIAEKQTEPLRSALLAYKVS